MSKICFLVLQYGMEVNGGAEIHCRMLAEALSAQYEVDVLTTKLLGTKLEPYYENDYDRLNSVNILRFNCKPFDAVNHRYWHRKTKMPRKIRRILFKMRILKKVASLFPVWNWGLCSEKKYQQSHGFYAPDLLAYLEKNKDTYKAIICMSYGWPHTVLGASVAPAKTILIPTAHNESDLFRPIQTYTFSIVAHIAFNTPEEQNLCHRVFANNMAPSSIVAVWVATAHKIIIGRTELQERYGVPSHYVFYFGRISKGKMGNLIEWFLAYKKKYKNDLKLVLTGRLFEEEMKHPDIIYTGFVSEEEKLALIRHAKIAINPSARESLSLLMLEAMSLGKMVLVNGRSDVMKGHCIRSGFAADYYISKQDFISKLQQYTNNELLLASNGEKARQYVAKYYDKDIIVSKFIKIIESL